MAEEPLVSAEEVASVLSSDEQPPETATDATAGDGDYSLRRPLAIAPAEEIEARSRLERLADVLAEAMAKELHIEVAAELHGFRQQPAGAAIESMAAPIWVLSFVCHSGGGAALVLDSACAMTLVELALGGLGNSPAEPREPTPLEGRVMQNLGAAVVARLGKTKVHDFSESRFGVGRIPTEVAASGETVGVGMLKLRFMEEERNCLLAVSAGLLRDAPTASRSGPRLPGPMASLLCRVAVQARPVLEAGFVTLRDLGELAPGDVLKLEAEQDRPLQLRVLGKPVFTGSIGREEGAARFAVGWRRGPKEKEPSAEELSVAQKGHTA